MKRPVFDRHRIPDEVMPIEELRVPEFKALN